MLFCNPELFSVARSAKLGECRLHPGLADLREWISTEFGVSVVHIVQDHIDIGPAEGRPRLNVILETDEDLDSWKTDALTISREVQEKVVQRFERIASNYPDLESENVHLILDTFSDECLVRACYAFLKNDAKQITNDFGFALLTLFVATSAEAPVNGSR